MLAFIENLETDLLKIISMHKDRDPHCAQSDACILPSINEIFA